jgi:hypothetical protein
MLPPTPPPGKRAIRTAGNSTALEKALFRLLQLLQLRVDIQLGVLAHQLQQ